MATVWPKPAEILEFYNRSLEAHAALAKQILAPDGSLTAAPGSRFFGMPAAEVRQELGNLRRELENQVVMLLTASFEATIQVAARSHLAKKRKTPMARAFRKKLWPTRAKLQEWTPVEKVLRICHQHAARPQAIADFKQLLEFRNWLAHGRYWVQKSGLLPDPLEAWEIGKALFEALPGFSRLSGG
jgi:hypothetical protein